MINFSRLKNLFVQIVMEKDDFIITFCARNIITKKDIGSIEFQIGDVERHFLREFAVDKLYRRIGIGTRLFENVVNEAKKKKINEIYVQPCPTDSENVNMETLIDIYQKLGFVKYKKSDSMEPLTDSEDKLMVYKINLNE